MLRVAAVHGSQSRHPGKVRSPSACGPRAWHRVDGPGHTPSAGNVASPTATQGFPRGGGASDAPAHTVSWRATSRQEGWIMDKPSVMTMQTNPQRKAPLPLTSFRPTYEAIAKRAY